MTVMSCQGGTSRFVVLADGDSSYSFADPESDRRFDYRDIDVRSRRSSVVERLPQRQDGREHIAVALNPYQHLFDRER
jgi:hypothetical protein